MKLLRQLVHKATAAWRRREDEQRLAAEIESHLAEQTADNIRSGLSPEEARRQAILKFGSLESTREAWREQRSLPFFETLASDTRLALRRLRHAPAFTATAILTLALGIGATTSISTLAYAVLFKSLSVANPNELVRLGKDPRCCYWGGYTQDNEYSLVSFELYNYFKKHTRGFAELAAFSASETTLGVHRAGTSEIARPYPGESVSGNYFRMFGLNAYAGRLLTSSDDRPGAPPVAVMSYRLWRDRYASDPSIIGTVFNLNAKPYTIVGITPPNFFGDTLRNSPPDFYLPLTISGDGDLRAPNLHWLELIGRIQHGAGVSSIQAQMRIELKQWLRSHWQDMSANEHAQFAHQTLFLSPGGAGITSMRHDYEHWLQSLMGATGFVLLIICANLANLMIMRGFERRRQISLSIALGAKPSRLLRQVLTETTLVSVLGGALGIAIAFSATGLLLQVAFPPETGLAMIPIGAAPSLPVLCFALFTSILVGFAFGLAPAWMTARVDPIEALRGGSRTTAPANSIPRRALMILQTALCFALLVASGLLVNVLHRLEHQDFGFDQDRRLIVNTDPRLAGYPFPALPPLYRRIHDSLAAVPGIEAVALCIYSPLSGNNWNTAVWIDGRPTPGPNEDASAFWERVSAGYFDAIGTPILRGRGISARDIVSSRHVAVVNQAFAHKFFRNQDPIGKVFGRPDMEDPRLYEIVGVAKDARYLTSDLDKPVEAAYFLPEAQIDIYRWLAWTEGDYSSHYMRDIVLLTQPGAHVTDTQIRRALASVDPNLPVIEIRTLRDQVSAVFRDQRLLARLTSFFGLLSLLLASIGLYGLTAYNATQRTSEIGIRIALGANRLQILSLVLRGALSLIAIGLALGLPLSLAAAKILGSQLYGATPYNVAVTAISITALAFSALIAALIPALRAGSILPLEALRTE